jgi:hypothetical protein
MREIFEIDDSVETRLWNKYTSNTYEQLCKPDISVQASIEIVLWRKKNSGCYLFIARVIVIVGHFNPSQARR